MSFDRFLEDFSRAKAASEHEAFAVVTLARNLGSTPQELGARMIVTARGLFSGTVGGGKIEMAAIERAKGLIAESTATSSFHEWNLQTDLGMSCGGVVGMLFEIVRAESNWPVAIFGAGHVAQELVRLLLRLDCQITVVDSREEWLEKLPTDSKLRRLHMPTPEDYVSDLHPKTFVVIATMGHATDLPIIEKVLRSREFPYVGSIGSETKAKKLQAELRERGVATDRAATLHCPIGEPIGRNTPPEIALSIASQLLRVRGR